MLLKKEYFQPDYENKEGGESCSSSLALSPLPVWEALGVRRPGRIRGEKGFAAQAESLDASGLAFGRARGNIRSLPPWSNPSGKMEFAALVDSYCDMRVLDESVHT